jgi:CheY-like chemotaxis protein
MRIPGRSADDKHAKHDWLKRPAPGRLLDRSTLVTIDRGPAEKPVRPHPSRPNTRFTAGSRGRSSSTEGAVKRRSVLLVEDDLDSREMLAIVLMAAGCQVWTAADGKAGLDVAAAHPIDLVITDFAMPRMDGIQMVRQLRQQRATSDIPVIVVTGQAVADVPATAHAAGCTVVLSKPCCPDYLVSVVNEHIGTRRNDRSPQNRPSDYRGRERRHA